MDENKVIDVKNLSVLIKDRFLIKNVTFCVEKGQCFGILGEDKSGKTSLIKAISGSLPINLGQVYLFGKDIFKNKKVLTRVSTCLDPPVFFKFNTVLNNMKYISALSEHNDKNKIFEILKKFGLEKRANTRVLFLPYHEKKLMAIALSLLTNPDILLLDEPFKNLPKQSLKIVENVIRQEKAKGTTIMISTQNFESIEPFCDKFIFMENRQIKEILDESECEHLSKMKTYAFIKVKYPHYAGKLLMENFDIKVKLLDKKILFESDEDETAEMVRFLSKHKFAIYGAGFINKKAEKIFASLTPYFKEEEKQ